MMIMSCGDNKQLQYFVFIIWLLVLSDTICISPICGFLFPVITTTSGRRTRTGGSLPLLLSSFPQYFYPKDDVYHHYNNNPCKTKHLIHRSGSSCLFARRKMDTDHENNKKQQQQQKKAKRVSLKDLKKEITGNPTAYNAVGTAASKKKKSRRSRKRVQNPKQHYVYASQKVKSDSSSSSSSTKMSDHNDNPLQLAKQYGLTNTGGQHCDALLDDVEPKILGQIRLVEEGQASDTAATTITPASFAYVIHKPAGWSILGSGGNDKRRKKHILRNHNHNSNNHKNKNNRKETKHKKRIVKAAADDFDNDDEGNSLEYDDLDILFKGKLDDDNDDFVDDNEIPKYDELAILQLLTPEERLAFQQEATNSENPKKHIRQRQGTKLVFGDPLLLEQEEEKEDEVYSSFLGRSSSSYTRPSVVSWFKEQKRQEGTPIRGGKYWKAIAGAINVDDSGLVLLCPKDLVGNLFLEYIEYVAVVGNGQFLAPIKKRKNKKQTITTTDDNNNNNKNIKMDILSKLRKGRSNDPVQTVSILITEPDGEDVLTCDSIVPIIQNQFADGIRGDPMANPFDRRAPRRLLHCHAMSLSSLVFEDSIEIDLNRSHGSSNIDGSRGGRRSNSDNIGLPDDIAIYAQRKDIQGRGGGYQQGTGSFLGRSKSLFPNPFTNAYREINGAADGYPNWIVDRYDKWLLVQYQQQKSTTTTFSPPKKTQEDDDELFGTIIPSIHDGNTAGVYYIQNDADRSAMGSLSLVSAMTMDTKDGNNSNDKDRMKKKQQNQPLKFNQRPRLLEGQRAPTVLDGDNDDDTTTLSLFPIVENGITYLVSLDKDLSTGLFLDQRYQRAWLTRYCNSNTRVLNCFAHCGGYSIAAAKAGASTVSIDLSQKWLNRIPLQFEYNNIPYNDNNYHGENSNNHNQFQHRNKKHDCIYGDVFDWLTKLEKRKDQLFDIVILDPPSSSVGGGPRGRRGKNKKAQRWSVKQDMPELVSLASRLVKKGGYLWTTTNNASISPIAFAKLCQKGLDKNVGGNTIDSSFHYKLERIQPMPHDFPTIGPQSVKNYMWKRM